MLSDIEIAQSVTPKEIGMIAQALGIDERYLERYGSNKAKVDYNLLREQPHTPGKLVLVTAINPTPAGEGKTTTTVGLADALKPPGPKRRGRPARALLGAGVRREGRRRGRRLRAGRPHGGHQPALHR